MSLTGVLGRFAIICAEILLINADFGMIIADFVMIVPDFASEVAGFSDRALILLYTADFACRGGP